MSRLTWTVIAVAALFALAPAAQAQDDVNAACLALGAESGSVITIGSGATVNLCWFEDARACTLEARQAGDCPEYGRKTTGYLTDAARYCAWLGGEVNMVDSAVEGLDELDGTCTLPDGNDCLIGRLYYGSCG